MNNNQTNDNSERFVRWHQNLREHLTFLNNLILTLAVGTFGFLISLLVNENFIPISCQKIFFTLGLCLIFLSILIGLLTSFSRLFDFRTTLQKIKNDKSGNYFETKELKKLMDYYGKTTWKLFYGQVIFFFFGILNLVIAFLMIFKTKLF